MLIESIVKQHSNSETVTGFDEIEFADSENWRGGGTTKIQEIILRNFQKAIIEGSKEMTAGGGVVQRLVNGELIEVPVPNQREVFINSVQMLGTVLKPHLLRNPQISDDTKQIFADFETKLKELDDRYMKQVNELNTYYSKRCNAMTPQGNQCIAEFNNKLRYMKDSQELERVDVYKKCLEALSFLLNDLGYLVEKGFVAGID